MICECGNENCDRVIAISIREYVGVRSDPTHFAVVKAHILADVEVIAAETDRFVVVEKREGTPPSVAEEEDPRS